MRNNFISKNQMPLQVSPRRKGSIAVVVALSMVAIMGFAALAVDFGVGVNDKNHLQRSCDAAALAGASKLKTTGDDTVDTTAARNLAIAVAKENGATVTAADVTFLNENKNIRVASKIVRRPFFAAVIKSSLGEVSAYAIAGVDPVVPKPPGVVPIGIRESTWNTYKDTTTLVPIRLVRPVDTDYAIGNFIVFDLRPSGKSPAHMLDQLMGVDFPEVGIGDWLTSLNADDKTVGDKFQVPLANRFQNSSKLPWLDTWAGNVFSPPGIRYTEINNSLGTPTAGYNNPRVMSLVVNADDGMTPTGGGTYRVQIMEFAPVYLESYTANNPITGEVGPWLNIRFLQAPNGGTSAAGGRKVTLLR